MDSAQSFTFQFQSRDLGRRGGSTLCRFKGSNLGTFSKTYRQTNRCALLGRGFAPSLGLDAVQAQPG